MLDKKYDTTIYIIGNYRIIYFNTIKSRIRNSIAILLFGKIYMKDEINKKNKTK